jgi:choline dehydrogenase-like flavoprotein
VFGYHDNDRKLIGHALARMTETMTAAGASDIWSAERMAHLWGTCRMGSDPSDSVVNGDCRAHDIPNLFVCDGAVFSDGNGSKSLTDHRSDCRTHGRPD